MAATYCIEPIYGIPTRRLILLRDGTDHTTAGYLYPPKADSEPWEVWPCVANISLLPDSATVADAWRPRMFGSEADMLAFLGLAPALEPA